MKILSDTKKKELEEALTNVVDQLTDLTEELGYSVHILACYGEYKDQIIKSTSIYLHPVTDDNVRGCVARTYENGSGLKGILFQEPVWNKEGEEDE